MPNIFLKSILRQPVKLTVLVILLAAATFVVTLRVAEYVIIRQEIARIEGYYRAVGQLLPMGTRIPDELLYSIEQLMEMERRGINPGESPPRIPRPTNINFADYVWQEMIERDHRVEFADVRRVHNSTLLDLTGPYIEGSLTTIRAGYPFAYVADAVFTATLVDGELSPIVSSPYNPFRFPDREANRHVVQRFVVEEVLVGHPEHLWPGAELSLVIQVIAHTPIATYDMSPGNTYLIRAFFSSFAYAQIHRSPRPVPSLDPVLMITPLQTGGDVYFLDTNCANYYKRLYELMPDIARADYQTRAMRLVTTVDGSASHVNRGNADYRLLEGRWTNLEDYHSGSLVAVIHQEFSRRANIGDTIRLMPQIDCIEEVLELTIVGIYDRDNLRGEINMRPQAFHYVFVPASIDLSAFTHRYWQHATNTDSLYSFVLHSPRYQDEFFRDIGPQLLAMGYALAFIPTNFELFASVADPIIQNLIINLVVFCASGLTVLLLVGFIYMRMANKNLALCRALGMPRHTALRRAVAPIILFALPAMGIGAVAAWWYATTSADGTLAPLYELEPHLAATSSLGLSSVLWLAAGIVAVTVGIVLVMVVQRLRKPVLRLLQGN